jgi:hypothetical protein
VTFDESYLSAAQKLMNYAIEHFYDPESGLFFVTSSLDPPLIARKHEIYDNVIPSSNSVMAGVLDILGQVYERNDFLEISLKMVLNIRDHLMKYPSAFANWGSVMLKQAHPFYTVVVTGPQYVEKVVAMSKFYHPQVFFCGSEAGSGLPIFKDRFVKGETMIYVCSGSECKLPTSSVDEAFLFFSQINTD